MGPVTRGSVKTEDCVRGLNIYRVQISGSGDRLLAAGSRAREISDLLPDNISTVYWTDESSPV